MICFALPSLAETSLKGLEGRVSHMVIINTYSISFRSIMKMMIRLVYKIKKRPLPHIGHCKTRNLDGKRDMDQRLTRAIIRT